MTVTEYATLKGISTQAVSNHLKRYKRELSSHIKMRGRSRLLDEFAVDFLNEKVTGARITVYDGTKDEEIKQLQAENKELHQRLITVQQDYLQVQKDFLNEKDRANELEQAKLRIEGAAEQAAEKVKNLESAAEQAGAKLEQAEADRDRAEGKMERLQARRLTFKERITGRLQSVDAE